MNTWSLIAGGDIFLGDSVDSPTLHPTLKENIRNADLSIANLEGPITTRHNSPPKSGPCLRMSKKAVERELLGTFNVLSLANNHIMDYGELGLEDTLAFLKQCNIVTVGAGLTEEEAYQPAFVRADGVSVAIVAGSEREFGAASGGRGGAAWTGNDRFWKTLSSARMQSDILIVCVHGGVELLPLPPPHWRKLLADIAAAGANVIIGHHPHLLQGWELLGKVPIFYSLGDLCFSMSSNARSEWRKASALSHLRFEKSTLLDFRIIPTWLNSNGVVQCLKQKEFDSYAAALCELLTDDKSFLDLWKSAALTLYKDRYQPWFLGSPGLAHIGQRIRHIFVLLLVSLGISNHPAVREYHLFLLNLLRNESHYAVARDGIQMLLEASDAKQLLYKERVALVKMRYKKVMQAFRDISDHKN